MKTELVTVQCSICERIQAISNTYSPTLDASLNEKLLATVPQSFASELQAHTTNVWQPTHTPVPFKTTVTFGIVLAYHCVSGSSLGTWILGANEPVSSA